MLILVDPYPALRIRAFTTTFARPLGQTETPDLVAHLFQPGAPSPFAPDEQLRTDIRDMLRHGGYKPTGRGKPSAEYLVRAAQNGRLGPINAAVDACNAASLHGGFPISVVDLQRAASPFRIALAPPDTRFIFNRSGQEIDVSGLLCLHDAAGPCANAVKDAQRTKTDDSTTTTLSVIWGAAGHEQRLAQVTAWYADLLTSVATVRSTDLREAAPPAP